MCFRNFVFVSLLLPSLCLAAPLGPQGSGGGKGVVCRTPQGKVKSVELLDLWEAREVFHHAIPASNASVAQQVALAIGRLENIADANPASFEDGRDTKGHSWHYSEPQALALFLQAQADLFLKKDPSVIRLRGENLTLTADSFEVATPAAPCAVEQLVHYEDAYESPQIFVNQDLVDRLDRTDQAALLAHEALYAYLRSKDQEKDSIRVRRAIGYVFGGASFPSNAAIFQGAYATCTGAGVSLYLRPEAGDGELRAVNLVENNKLSIGFFDTKTAYTLGTLDELEKGTCTGGQGLEITNFPNPGAGPVDFSAMSWILDVCDSGKRSYYVSPQQSDFSTLPTNAVKLDCDITPAPAK